MANQTESENVRKAGAFDIRTFIALLIGAYGVVLVVMGAFVTDEKELAKADGFNINLWAGIGMIVVAALFQAWAMWRPVVVPPEFHEEHQDDPS